MLPARSVVQLSKTHDPVDTKIFSTYQDEFSNIRNHGSLIQHYGNDANLMKDSYNYSHTTLKPFLSPSYQNLTSQYCISNRFSDNYTNNYRTSDDNLLKRSLRTAPTKTKLDHLFKYKIHSIAEKDDLTVYRENYLNQIKNDHFVSQKKIKTETINLRDKIACLMELSDYMRNKSYDIFDEKNHLDYSGQLFSQLIKSSESLLLSYNRLNTNANELKKMYENFEFGEKLLDKNEWDRLLRPEFERKKFEKTTEQSIMNDRKELFKCKDLALGKLKQVNALLNLIENYIHKNLEQIVDEAKVLFMFKLNKKEYERVYLRDSNGYIRKDARLPIAIGDWFNLTNNNGIKMSDDLRMKSDEMNGKVIELINEIGEKLSENFLQTHQITSKQVENSLDTQNKLIDAQYDMNRELSQLDQSINDTKLKLRTTQMFDEVLLSQLRVPIAEVDPYYEKNKKRQANIANKIWSNSNDLKENLRDMLDYRYDLTDRNQRMYKNIYSNHVGVNYDLQTIVGPRRNGGVGLIEPSIGFVSKSLHNFHFK